MTLKFLNKYFKINKNFQYFFVDFCIVEEIRIKFTKKNKQIVKVRENKNYSEIESKTMKVQNLLKIKTQKQSKNKIP